MKNKDLMFEKSAAISLGKVQGRAMKPEKLENMLNKHILIIIMLGIEIIGRKGPKGKNELKESNNSCF